MAFAMTRKSEEFTQPKQAARVVYVARQKLDQNKSSEVMEFVGQVQAGLHGRIGFFHRAGSSTKTAPVLTADDLTSMLPMEALYITLLPYYSWASDTMLTPNFQSTLSPSTFAFTTYAQACVHTQAVMNLSSCAFQPSSSYDRMPVVPVRIVSLANVLSNYFQAFG